MHLHHGPIDLILDAEGAGRAAALAAARARFATVLAELVPELPALRRQVAAAPPLQGAIARRMQAATRPFLPGFVTPMAAVAGAVADTVLAAMCAAGPLRRAYVNNGGDVALHLGPGESFTAAMADDGSGAAPGRLRITAADPVRGVASSGRGGRSLSLGIADRVTVLAADAASADAAATLIANAVDLPGHPAIARQPACRDHPDSDLGARRVTTGLGPLSAAEVARALARGLDFAETCRARGLIAAACLSLRGQAVVCGSGFDPLPTPPTKEPADA